MKVSIIVPVYNVEKYLEKCIESLINQTLKDIEIIMINDGSLDESENIIKKYQSLDDRIILINQKNSGQGNARNNGLKNAKGEFIAFVDSDDFIDLDMMEKMYLKATNEKADICICNQKKVNEIGEISGIYNLNIAGQFGTCKTNPNILFVNLGPCNKIYKREIIEENKIQFPKNKLMWYEDLPFVAQCLLEAKKICWIEEPLYNYLYRENSTMNNQNINKNLDIIESFDILKNYCDINKSFYDELEFLCIEHVYIYTAVRIIKTKNKMKDKKKIIKKLKDYINEYYPNYNLNKYIVTLPKKRKIILRLLNKESYYLIKIMFDLKQILKKGEY